jgi:hypothetical protein
MQNNTVCCLIMHQVCPVYLTGARTQIREVGTLRSERNEFGMCIENTT